MITFSAKSLDRERREMRAYSRAFRSALKQFPATAAPHPHLLAQIDAMMAALDPYDEDRQAWETVVEFLRLHPDMLRILETLRTDLSLTEQEAEDLADAVFRAAMQIEAA